MKVPMGLCPGLVWGPPAPPGEGRGMLGLPGQLEGAGDEASECDDGNGLESAKPAQTIAS